MGKIYTQGDMRMKLSCLILTKNNAKTLEYALRTIHKYADEIVLLDSGSDDDTLRIARRYTDKIFFMEFDGDFGKQKIMAYRSARGSGFLSLILMNWLAKIFLNAWIICTSHIGALPCQGVTLLMCRA